MSRPTSRMGQFYNAKRLAAELGYLTAEDRLKGVRTERFEKRKSWNRPAKGACGRLRTVETKNRTSTDFSRSSPRSPKVYRFGRSPSGSVTDMLVRVGDSRKVFQKPGAKERTGRPRRWI